MTAHSSPDTDELSAHSAEDQQQEQPTPPSPTPPSYPLESTPAYTPRPHGAEQTVVRGPPTAAELTGTVEYAAKRFRVAFGAQAVGRTPVQGPEYARGAKVRGAVTVVEKWRDRVGSVDLKVRAGCAIQAAEDRRCFWRDR